MEGDSEEEARGEASDARPQGEMTMSGPGTIENPALRKVVDDLASSLKDRLLSVVLYGSAARGDYEKETSDLNLIVVMKDLEPGSLEALGPPLARWRRQGQPVPRIFSPALILQAADVFPIELLDIGDCRVVLHGQDPFTGLTVHLDHLRLQCERELREKMMRLREAYAESHASPKELKRLLTGSYTTFVALFRGCLRLLGGAVPVHNHEVVEAFCGRAGLDSAPFLQVDRMKRGEDPSTDPKELFVRYYSELTKAVERVDRFEPEQGGDAP